MISIKRVGYLSFTSVAVLLIIVILMGFRQNQLTQRYNSVITESEAIIFQFSTLREQITTALIGRDWAQAGVASNQLGELNSSLSRIQENPLIPGEYRLDLAKQADISGIAILAKEIANGNNQIAKSLILQEKMRGLADYLIRFDRIIVSQVRSKVIQFQTIMIGLLAIVICLISFSLIFLYKKTMLPLYGLTSQLTAPDVLSTGLQTDPKSCAELHEITYIINALLVEATEQQVGVQEIRQLDEQLGATLNEGTNLANGIINYAQLLADSYREVEMGVEEIKILQSIMEAAERIASLNRNDITQD